MGEPDMPDDTTSTPGDGPTGDGPSSTTVTVNNPTPAAQGPTQAPSIDYDAEIAKHKALSRKHETNWERATRELEQTRQTLADRDLALNDTRTDSAKAIAVAQLQVGLARAGMAPEAADNYTKFLDAGRLLKDGKPDPEAIAQLVAELPASLRTGPPDPDQGRASNRTPLDMNQLIRRSAGLG